MCIKGLDGFKTSIEFVLNTIVTCLCLQQENKVYGNDTYLNKLQICGRPVTSFYILGCLGYPKTFSFKCLNEQSKSFKDFEL